MANRRETGRRSETTRMTSVQVAFGLGAALAGMMLASAAKATLLKFPKTDPRVSIEVPDNWTTSYTAEGFELQSPEKNSLIVAGVVGHNEHAVETWAKAANKAMGAEGVVFAKHGKPTRTVIPKPDADESSASTDRGPPDAQTQVSGEAFSFSGNPSVAPPFAQGKDRFAAAIAKAKGPVTPYKVVQTFGATLNSQPVDIELAMYTLSNDQLFVIEQQSGQTDGRAAVIVKSYRPLR